MPKSSTDVYSDNMAGWHGHFAAKYAIVGELIEA
jgi:hypothetical protein